MNKKIVYCLLSGIALLTSPVVQAEARHEKQAGEVEEMSDTWLEAKLTTVYTLNPHLSIFDIDVDVRDQVVYLSGTVESDVEKDLASEIAESVDGVKNIENKITVVRGESNKNEKEQAESTTNSFLQTVSDLTTTASVKSQLLANSEIEGLDVDVSTENNRVTLEGIVASDTHASLAEKIARNTDGVTEVVNKLEVKKTS